MTTAQGTLRPGYPVWMVGAVCAQTDPERFFPEKGGSTRAAKAICWSCDVRAECLQYALENDDRHGIWGGLAERERKALRRAIAARQNPVVDVEPQRAA